MGFLAFLILATVAIAACAFVAWPALKADAPGRAARWALAGSVVALVLAIGGGSYLMLGRPDLAARSLVKTEERDYAGLIATLAHDIRKNPSDVRGWVFLGAGYMKLRDPDDAAKSFARAIQTAGPKPPAGLYSLYGEALTEGAAGQVGPEAEAAFKRAAAIDPRNISARYYLGLMYAQKGTNNQALALWRGLLADGPKDAPWRQEVVDRIAMLSASGGVAPDIGAMVAGLAARLKSDPNDAQGWQRLIRAYVVLGQRDKAEAALRDARLALAKDSVALNALRAESQELKLGTN